MANMNESANIIGRNNSRESTLSPSDVGVEYIRYEPAHAIQTQPPRVSANSIDEIRSNEFREILNTAVQAAQPERQIQRQPEILGKFFDFFCMVIRKIANLLLLW